MSSATSDAVLPVLPGLRLREEIGRGGFGVVYAGTDERGDAVAVKVLHRVLDEDARRRFDAEIQIMGTLAWHPNIVRIHDAGAVGGQPYIVMEHLAAGSLGAELRRDGALPWAVVLRDGVAAATALQVAHNAGLLHRDVKPDNLLRAEAGGLKLSDFGVTVAARGGDAQRGATGTLAYSAPELLAGGSPSPVSDVYALGATLFALLRGDPAFHRTTDESPAAMVVRAYRDPVPDLRLAGVPESLCHVVERAMAKDPADRPASAADLVKALRGAAAAESVDLPPAVPTGQERATAALPLGGPPAPGAPPDGRPSAASRRRARRLQRISGAMAGVAALVIAVSVVTVGDFRPDGGDQAQPTATSLADEAPPASPAPDASLPEDLGAGDPPDPPLGAAPPPAPVPTPSPGSAPPAVAPAPPAPAPPPAPPPPPPAPAAAALPTLALDAPATGGAGEGGLTVTATTTALEVHDREGTRTAVAPIAGASDLAVTEGVVAAVTGDVVLLLDAEDLGEVGRTTVPRASEIAGTDGTFWAATDSGVVRIAPTGQTAAVGGGSAAMTQIAAAGGVVWTATDGGAVVALDGASGRPLGGSTLPGKVVELTALPDGSALALVDGGLHRLAVEGGTTPVAVGAVVRDVAATDRGVVYVLTDAGLGRLDAQGLVPVASGEVQALWPAGGAVSAAVRTPPSIERFG